MTLANLANLPDLPNDINSLKKIISEQQQFIVLQEQKYLAIIEEQRIKLEKLEHELSVLKRIIFGRRSEKLSGKKNQNEGSVNNNEGNEGNDAGKEGKEEKQKKQNNKNRNSHHNLPDNVERKRIEYQLDDTHCPCGCGQILKKIGEEISQTLEVIPAKLYILEHVRYKYAGCLHKDKVITAPMPTPPIEKCLAGPSLLADVIIKKYDDHLPLYRQSEILLRSGIRLSRSTLCGWVGQSAKVLECLVGAMRDTLLESFRINTDDTTVPVLSPKTGKTITGRLWVYSSEEKGKPSVVVYDYSPDRSQQWPVKMLDGFKGYVQADAYGGYDILYREKGMVEVGCWAHARRKFFELAQNHPNSCSTAHQAVDKIKVLYDIERDIKELTYEKKTEIRQAKSVALLKAFKEWLENESKKELPKSLMKAAIHYTLNHWEALNRYTEHGGLSIDNNVAERLIKPIVVGRRNWMFAGSHEGGKTAAILYSLIETAKLHHKNPYDYLTDVLSRINDHKMKNLHELLPWNWTPPTIEEDPIPELLKAA